MPSVEPESGSFAKNVFQAIVPGDSHTRSVGASSAQSAQVGTKTSIVRLFCTVDCFIKIGANPTAAATDMFLPGGIIEYYGCNPGDKVAAIQSSTGGTLYITEGA